jgi:hypothetical protein
MRVVLLHLKNCGERARYFPAGNLLSQQLTDNNKDVT